jgi:hypothetical protein
MTNRQVAVLVVVLAGLLLVLPCVLVVGGTASWLVFRARGPPPAGRQGDPQPVPAAGERQDGPARRSRRGGPGVTAAREGLRIRDGYAAAPSEPGI